MASSTANHAADAAHHGPHIPRIQGEAIEGLSVFGYDITTTVLSTWIFMAVLFVVIAIFYTAIKTNAFPKIRNFGLDALSRLDNFIIDTVGNKKYARIYFPMLGGFFVFILLANIFGLMLDWNGLVSPWAHQFIRPFNSDMGTTLALALVVIIICHIGGMIHKGFIGHWKHFLFNFSGNSLIEKVINVPVGWIHLLSEFARILSLSVRLFANIFAGVALILVMQYLGDLIGMGGIGGLFVLPIWFFEILVAFLQAFIFTLLSCLYIQEATTVHH